MLSPDGCLRCSRVCNIVILCSWLFRDNKFCEWELSYKTAWRQKENRIHFEITLVFPDVIITLGDINVLIFCHTKRKKVNRTLHHVRQNPHKKKEFYDKTQYFLRNNSLFSRLSWNFGASKIRRLPCNTIHSIFPLKLHVKCWVADYKLCSIYKMSECSGNNNEILKILYTILDVALNRIYGFTYLSSVKLLLVISAGALSFIIVSHSGSMSECLN